MKEWMFVAFLLVMSFLIVMFIIDTLRRGKNSKAEKNDDSLFLPWIVTSIVATLVAQQIISKEEAEQLSDATLEEVEDYLLEQDYFEASEDFHSWITSQPELTGMGDSIMGSPVDGE
jgi:hypothetical protein